LPTGVDRAEIASFTGEGIDELEVTMEKIEVDPILDMFWLGMIEAQGNKRPGSAIKHTNSRDITYDSIVR